MIYNFHLRFLIKRSKSAVELRKKEIPPQFIMKDDIDSNLKELAYQRRKQMERQVAKQRALLDLPMKESLESLHEIESLKCLSFSLVEASRKAGISYIVFPSKRKKVLKKGFKFQRVAQVYEQLSRPPKKIERFRSNSSYGSKGEGYYVIV